MRNDQDQWQDSDNTYTQEGMLTGMFHDRSSKEKAYNTLHERG